MELLQISEPSGQFCEKHKKIILGIDLGTTNSLVAFINDNDSPEVLCDDFNRSLFPSVVGFLDDGKMLTSHKAFELNSNEIVSSFKKFMGRSFEDSKYLHSTYELLEKEGILKIHTSYGDFTPLELSSKILSHLYKIAINRIGREVKDVIITVPAYFNETQRQDTILAARLVGLNVIRLLNEPTAAAIAYGIGNLKEGIYAVFDLGGGTFDISILKLMEGVFDVIATSGDNALGGDDFDLAIVDYVINLFTKNEVSFEEKSNLMRIAKETRECLTNNDSALFYTPSEIGSHIEISNSTFYEIVDPLIKRISKCIKRSLVDAKLRIDDICGVIMVGGSTRMPIVRDFVSNYFKKKDLLSNIDPDKVVAIGAALYGDMLLNRNSLSKEWQLLDVTPLSLGIEVSGGLVERIIHRNSKIPVSHSQDFTTMRDGQTAMKIHVLQGESDVVEKCRSLSYFELNNIPAMPAGKARINITFQIDSDGLLLVSAKEKSTGLGSSVIVNNLNRMLHEDIRSLLQSDNNNLENKDSSQLHKLKSRLRSLVNSINSILDADYSLIGDHESSYIQDRIMIANKMLNAQDINSNKLMDDINYFSLLAENFAKLKINRSLQETLLNKKI
ncbi:molecular chaperone HscA [Candidatus Kinetoplastibacterium blastocrithidii (ex Strigomonas culicis)]|uniref:Molecular chaperone HscA n=1 Tax=Strigomonas culicis TaxID=28005 RepID=S9WCB4_9TRYP|nr:Fe-S protein assembly chaperone HscA [Candidatus Kinetoplastibacterium blastocrithidii]AFZ83568.1 molecular chaperone HscA [Candidatus Kinetoplastibacterium blastocrithidii (ex Strigomonas culicis)]EPY33670.1 molecular chaperone HscA [Strigomonas culicis]|eukprot:EPY33670.1 molecular chaperone HscA [Strigomonas culicis]